MFSICKDQVQGGGWHMVRFGVVGTNFITERFIEAGRDCQDFAVTAVYSRTAERGQVFADQQNVPHVFTSLREMAQSGEIDAVYIASPTSSHAEQAKEALGYGMHVLCEKPIVSNAAEMRELMACAKENNVALMEAMIPTLTPGFEQIQEWLPRLGTIRRVVFSYCQYSSRYDAYKAGTVLNAFKPEYSNGALMDIGVYGLYPIVTMFGRPNKVSAQAYMLDSGVDGQGAIMLQYDQMDGIVQYSKIGDSHLPSEILGEAGSLLIDSISRPGQLTLKLRGGETLEWTQPSGTSPMTYEIAAFIEVVQQGRSESAINSWDRSLATLEIMDEARRQIGLVFPADH